MTTNSGAKRADASAKGESRMPWPDWYFGLREPSTGSALSVEGLDLYLCGERGLTSERKPHDHGTRGRYVAGCRCGACKGAQRAYDAERYSAGRLRDYRAAHAADLEAAVKAEEKQK